MSSGSDDRVRLIEHGDSHQEEQERLGTEQSLPAIRSSSTQVQFSSRTPRLVMANKTTTRGAASSQAHQPALLVDAVYGDGNVFVTDERVKSARSRCNYVRAVIAILMLPIFVLLILAITGILPIGLGTHDDVLVPSSVTGAQPNHLQHVQQHVGPTSTPHAVHAQHQQQAAEGKLLDEQQLNDVKNKVAQALTEASPGDVQKLMDTALNGALQMLGSAGGKEKSLDDVSQQLDSQLAEVAMRNAAQKALSEAQKNPKSLLKGVKAVVGNVGGAQLTAAKLSDAIQPGVMGPNDKPQLDAPLIRPEPMMEDAPTNQEELNRILQNALRRRGSS